MGGELETEYDRRGHVHRGEHLHPSSPLTAYIHTHYLMDVAVVVVLVPVIGVGIAGDDASSTVTSAALLVTRIAPFDEVPDEWEHGEWALENGDNEEVVTATVRLAPNGCDRLAGASCRNKGLLTATTVAGLLLLLLLVVLLWALCSSAFVDAGLLPSVLQQFTQRHRDEHRMRACAWGSKAYSEREREIV